ncbi:MAG TPA: energy transducer TonB [Bryobacteraceae bacterium]|jgi:TonB family protein|nr:energy transducer TonB [Bryobacteraceae bacterium]
MTSEKKPAQPILNQTLFHTAYVPSPTWRSYLTSTVVHGAILLALLLITVPAIQEVQKRRVEHITLIAPPPLPTYHPKIVPRVTRNIETPRLIVKNEPKPKIEPIKPIEVKPITVPKRELAAAPEIKPTVTPPHALPDIKAEMPAPKPPVQTGVFRNTEQAKGAVVPKETKLGGFGDPHGVPASADSHPSQLTMAQVGSFDLPQGAGHAGGGGHGAAGGVRQGSFGAIGDPSGVPGGTGRGPGRVQTGAFGEATAGQATGPVAKAKPVEPATTPVEILSKPKPRYTEEARNLKLEGQVSLDVVFQANGSVRVVRIVHGLGHGLDEAAEEAATQVRFRPATRDGVPVDSNATIRITFQLT